jgi:hypothetical protein
MSILEAKIHRWIEAKGGTVPASAPRGKPERA